MSKLFLRLLAMLASVILALCLAPPPAQAAKKPVPWQPVAGPIMSIPKGTGKASRSTAHLTAMRKAVKAAVRGTTIRATTYSSSYKPIIADFIAAKSRGVHVRFTTWHEDYAKNRKVLAPLRKALGTNTKKASYFKVCQGSCYRTGKDDAVQHTKIVTVGAVQAPKGIQRYIVFESSGTFSKAGANRSWNFTTVSVGRKKLYNAYASYIDGMRHDRTKKKFRQVKDGNTTVIFYPGGPDPLLSTLKSIKSCKAAKGYGVNGKTHIAVVMYVWRDSMSATAKQLVRVAKLGCKVDVVITTPDTQSKIVAILKKGKLRLWDSRKKGKKGRYSHGKTWAISGRIGSNPKSLLTATGSANLSKYALKYNTEVTVLHRSAAMRQFVVNALGHIARYSKRLK